MTALTYRQRCQLVRHEFVFDWNHWRATGQLRAWSVRCPNDPCPSCDRLPGRWDGWCVRCGLPHVNGDETLCSHCDRLLFWQELFW